LQEIEGVSLVVPSPTTFEEIAISKDETGSPHLQFVADCAFASCTVWANLRISRHVCARIPTPLVSHTPTSGSISFTDEAMLTYRKRWMNSTIICAIIVPERYAISIRTCSTSSTTSPLLSMMPVEIDVICGYRTPWSNDFLRTRSAHTGVARHSLHMQAEAIDIRVPGIPTSAVRDAALRLRRGGVGYYRSSDFVHVDVGRVRQW
jgi:hypothetical protein